MTIVSGWALHSAHSITHMRFKPRFYQYFRRRKAAVDLRKVAVNLRFSAVGLQHRESRLEPHKRESGKAEAVTNRQMTRFGV